jgi:arylformamidase
MIQYDRVYDISVLVGVESGTWPGDPPYARRLISALADGKVADVSLLTMTAHTGTHLDAPGHFIPGGRKLDELPAEKFLLPARVIASDDPAAVPAEEIEAAGIRPGQAVLLKTRNSTTGRAAGGAFYRDGVYVSAAAAACCVRRRAALVGIDYFTVDRYGDEGFGAHRVLLEAGVLILECINLRDVPPGEYTLVCLPLRLHACEASPVRAVLVR